MEPAAVKGERAIRVDLIGHVAYAAAILLILAMGWALYDIGKSMKRGAAWSDEAMQSLRVAGDIDASMAGAEAAQGALLLSEDARFAAERDRTLEAAARHAQALLALPTLASLQREQATQLKALVAQRTAAMRDEVALRSAQGEQAGSAIAGLRRAAGASPRDLVAQFRAEELRRLATRRAAQDADFEGSIRFLVVVTALALVVLVPGYMGFVWLARTRERGQRRIFEMAEMLPAAAFQYRSFSDLGGRYEFFSRAAERLRGVSSVDALRDPEMVLGAVLERDRAVLQDALQKAGAEGKTLQHEFRVQDTEGRVRWLRVTAVPRPQADSGILWTGCWEDVTDRMRIARTIESLEAAAKSTEQARTHFVATINHEIRTPLSAALGALELLARDELAGPQRSAAYLAAESTKSALRVLDDMADFARIEAGNVSLSPEPVSLSAMLEELAASQKAASQSRGLALGRHVDERISASLMADPQRLRQILGNFLAAVVGSARDGNIDLRAELAEHRDGEELVKLSVRGPVPAEVLPGRPQLEPFVQASAQATRRYDGSGLGLATCQRLAQLMGGSIEATSEPGLGRLFVLTVPLPIAEAPAKEKAQPAQVVEVRRTPPSIDEARAEGTLVLAVDDHPVNRLVLLRQLNALGYAAESARDGVEALERWSSGAFALVITDCEMPEMDGYDLARQIRAAEARATRKPMPIIGCTANVLGDEIDRAFAAGMDDFMPKPIAMARLGEMLQRWLPLPGSPLALAPKTDRGPSKAP